MKDINIVFLNYMMKDDILRAIESLVADITGSVFDIQITVADNSENKDNIKEDLAKKFPQVDYVDAGGNIGFGAGNMKGFERTEARYYFALNRDTIIPKGTQVIDQMITYMDEHLKIGCIGPKLLNMDGTLQYSCYRFDFKSIFIKPLKQINFDKKYKWVKKHTDRLLMKDFDHNSTRPVDWVLGAAMMVRKEVMNNTGGFDDRFFMYLEDADWCHRMWEAGYPVYYVHDIVIKHVHARDSSKVPGIFKALFKNKLARIHLVSWMKYLWKWRGNYSYDK
ncbi:glycosyltransferase family 2 protein [Patescibacteria group bacterium]|nr:glycosyltransferase family 2 protein [Patescibacteria group bacterium]MBU1721732.1 glycosyltransferase family 2 protein [Patescibacteria group bacterium]MBU1901429.1 glycosyltransferase family 2 protein [Patescibacteria group bacterium]